MHNKPNKIRIITAASLFDGHDAAINIMRRIMQSLGAEIIHLGHNRSAREIVEAAIEEDVHGIAITSYQGGHIEFFQYIKDLLKENGCDHIKIFGGGGGTILPSEIEKLHAYGIERIYTPDDGRKMGLEGMIGDLLDRCKLVFDQPYDHTIKNSWGEKKDIRTIARSITLAEAGLYIPDDKHVETIPVLGITGTGGAGKSTMTDEIVRRFLERYPEKTMAVISVDPSKKRTGGALLGDRIRMNSVHSNRVYMRSMATRESEKTISASAQHAIDICKAHKFDLIILESAGAGQSDASIINHCDVSLYVMTPEYGAASQLEKINMLDYADVIALNKYDKPGALDALHDIKKQYKRNHGLWDVKDDDLPVIGTISSQFNDNNTNQLFDWLMGKLFGDTPARNRHETSSLKPAIIPNPRVRYLSEIADEVRKYNRLASEQAALASDLYKLYGAKNLISDKHVKEVIEEKIREKEKIQIPLCKKLIDEWDETRNRYKADEFEYQVRDKVVRRPLKFTSLSGTVIPKIATPNYKEWGDILLWRLQENFPGKFPYTASVFPLRNTQEDPTRMFAGEGTPERTNKRFHYLSSGQSFIRLSTAFDSVTLYGNDPDERPDIYGKIGNSGVSIATVDDAKKLYSGFDLCNPNTSVSMTINGPAPMLLAFFLHAAIDQACEKYIGEHGLWGQVEKIKKEKEKKSPLPLYKDHTSNQSLPEGHNKLGLRLLGLSGSEVLNAVVYDTICKEVFHSVRGTVQADILKEDQAQNTCIFSTEFALRLMGDVQSYFIDQQVLNFYSVSISGYHIAEAGANPITQLALTLANGFTYVEYYLARGMHIDAFAPNLSFFFSNGMDPEYSVIGRVARRVWAKVIKYKYAGNSRSQKLKYHIQTSGRSLHAQEIDFNDIRTTLQALYAIYDNCNSLHTNAYDEAITTPTEDSVRRAMAIQLIINKELGSSRTENFIQGSFIIEELTDLVEEAVMVEFEKLSERGGVLGAMERMYQRNKIQDESMSYESLKHKGEIPIIGVNTFLSTAGSPTSIPNEVIRSTEEEKLQQIKNLRHFKERNKDHVAIHLANLKNVAQHNGNLFGALMEAVKYCTLGQITQALYEVGGQYRRNM